MTAAVEDVDILIAGGGIAGMAAAAAFGRLGLRTLCVDPEPPVTQREAPGADLRTTAFLQPAQAFLDRIRLWDRLAPHASPLRVMRIVDAGGALPEARTIRDFDAAEIGDRPFGWNLPNWLLRREFGPRCVNFGIERVLIIKPCMPENALQPFPAVVRFRFNDRNSLGFRTAFCGSGCRCSHRLSNFRCRSRLLLRFRGGNEWCFCTDSLGSGAWRFD